ncbi:MAG: DUF4423 domain-containing protein, partial [Methylotenera sp.]|nr:DUF4423 domain-containing protein [Oligoflexia bacterium]
AYLKASQSGLSLRSLAVQAKLSSGYLPMVLSGQRILSDKALKKLSPFLRLNPQEKSYLNYLVQLGTSDSQEEKLSALEHMEKFKKYRDANTREIEVHRYLTRWYYVAIREMAALPGFKNDPAWIQRKLKTPVPASEIKAALDFLISKDYLKVQPDGTVANPERQIDCVGGVYRLALGKFHHEMLSLASDSIENTRSAERSIQGHTFAVSPGNFDQARRILDEAIEKIKRLSEPVTPEVSAVYHVEVALFPLTQANNTADSTRKKP